MSAQSIVQRSEDFMLRLLRQPNCSRNPRWQEQGQTLYFELIQCFSENKEEKVVYTVFALLTELHARHGLSDEIFKALSQNAVTVIESSKGKEIDPVLACFLEKQKQKFQILNT